MSQGRISMRKIKEMLRLKLENGLSINKAAVVCNIGRTTAQEYLRRFEVSGLTWPLPEEVTEEELESRLYPEKTVKSSEKLAINFEYLIQELRRPNVTIEVLWAEYKQANSNAYCYGYFCELLSEFKGKLNYSMRQEHKAGEKGFLDFGEGPNLIDLITGESIPTRLFVFVWGASNYTFAKAIKSEGLADWIKVNTEALEYFGCCPKACVPDNLKSAVTKACRYEPDINPTYAEFADHYGTVIMPARPYKPKDKAKVETGVKLAKRWILARLRDRIFTDLEEMNDAIMELLNQFNAKPLKIIKKSRKELFISLDKPNALSLPDTRYEYADWKPVTVNINYHVSYDDHNYSVPYTFIHQRLEVRASVNTVEIYKSGERICAHIKSHKKHGYTTVAEHMPPSHQKYLEWTPDRILNWALKSGVAVKALVEQIMKQRKYPEQAFKSCLGIIRLEKLYSAQRLNAACERALEFRVYSYKGVKNILIKNLDSRTISKENNTKFIMHENIRGTKYYEDILNIVNEPGNLH